MLVTPVLQKDVPIVDEFVGTLEALVNATIQARVQGYLISQNYKEGTEVQKDALLFTIDPRPFKAALLQAQAALMQAQAQQLQAEQTAQRNVELFKSKTASAQERDNAVQAAEAAKAQSQAQQAAVEQAQLNLDYTSIRSPVDGIAGLATAQVGDLVGPTTGTLTTVVKVNPIKVYFTISDQRYTNYAQRFSDPAARAAHEKQLEFTLVLSDGSIYPEKGQLYAAANQVDVRTGTVQVAAIFPNKGNILRPGQFARVRVQTNVQKGALLVPQRAVLEVQGTYHIDVVGPDNKVQIKNVQVGRRVKGMWIIDKGLEPGEEVIVEGVQKARDGAPVTPKPWSSPTPAPNQPDPLASPSGGSEE
ncbi:MAG TPA: efflux RND transporter periplasmic adaptor subunit [Chthoniobacterales bacterium]